VSWQALTAVNRHECKQMLTYADVRVCFQNVHLTLTELKEIEPQPNTNYTARRHTYPRGMARLSGVLVHPMLTNCFEYN